MVAIRTSERKGSCIPQLKIPQWAIALGVCFVLLTLNIAVRQEPDVNTTGTITNKLEEIFPKPDGTNDYNLVKNNSTSFNDFSFYLMGDTPVS